MAKRYEISDSEWERIENPFPSPKTGHSPRWDNKTMFNATLWLARSGSVWKDIPGRYPPHQSIYSRFCKWRDDGTLKAVFHALNYVNGRKEVLVISENISWKKMDFCTYNKYLCIDNYELVNLS